HFLVRPGRGCLSDRLGDLPARVGILHFRPLSFADAIRLQGSARPAAHRADDVEGTAVLYSPGAGFYRHFCAFRPDVWIFSVSRISALVGIFPPDFPQFGNTPLVHALRRARGSSFVIGSTNLI